MPSVETTSAPAGIATSPCRPTAVIRSPSITTTLSSSGGPPKPSISRPPTSALTCDASRPLGPDAGPEGADQHGDHGDGAGQGE